jgi:hypothetical protein
MPKIQRSEIPQDLLRHLIRRRRERGITSEDLVQLAHWLDTGPTVPEGDWYKRFLGVTICGRGTLVKTFLNPRQTALGKEVE